MTDDGTYTTMTAEEFEGKIRERLKRLGVTAIGCARRNDLPRDAIRSVLRGHEPSISRAAKICEALGLEFDVSAPSWERLVTDPSVGPGLRFPVEKNDQAPIRPPADPRLRALMRALAEEWETADEAGKEKLEIRFAAQFPELVKGRAN